MVLVVNANENLGISSIVATRGLAAVRIRPAACASFRHIKGQGCSME